MGGSSDPLYTFIMHKHHIIPRHEWKRRFGNLQGFNAPDNIVHLTIEQHSQVHQILYEMNGSRFDYIAWKGLAGEIGTEEILSAKAREANIGNRNRKGKGLGFTPWNKGKKNTVKFSSETIQRLRDMNSGSKHPQYGTKHSEETKRKLSIANSKPYDPERRARKLVMVRSPEHREKMRQARLRFLETKKVKA